MRFTLRAILGVVLLAGVYVLAVGVPAALWVALVVAVAAGAPVGVAVTQIGIALLILTVTLARALWAAHQTRPRGPLPGVAITPQSEPRLWDEVHALADTVGTRAPDEIRLLPDVNAGVVERTRLLGLVGGRRTLYLGAPLLVGLSHAQLRSVLAHELGHYSQRHVALGASTYRGTATLAAILERLDDETWLGATFGRYARLYHRVTGAVSRRQELEADGWSQRVAGSQVAASALREVTVLGPAWGRYLEAYAFAVPGSRATGIVSGFTAFLASGARRAELAELRLDPQEPPASPFDSHPPLAERLDLIAWLGDTDSTAGPCEPTPQAQSAPIPAVSLLDHADAHWATLEEWWVDGAGLTPRTWDSLAEESGLTRARTAAALLVRAAGQPGLGARSLDEAVAGLGRGNARQLVLPLLGAGASPKEGDDAARRLVAAAVAAALVEHCGARFAHSWDSTRHLVDTHGLPVDVPALVDGVTDRASAEQLLAALADEGVPAGFSVDPADADQDPAPAGAEPRLHAAAYCQRFFWGRVLVVSDTGILLKRVTTLEQVRATFRYGSNPFRNALRFVVDLPPTALLEDPHTQVFTWEQVRAVAIGGRHLSLTVSGLSRRTRVRDVAGDLVSSLGHHLGDRFAVS